jgi:DNA polymerase I-like protein with 3'-5' exonuclease and polymerase domains
MCRVDPNTGRTSVAVDFNFRKNSKDTIPELRRLMAMPCPKVAHNAEYELYLMEDRLGIPIKGTLYDTMLMAKHWRNDLPSYDLKSLSWWLLGDLYHPLTKLREWIHQHNLTGEDDIEFDMTQCPDRLVHNYCMHDIKMTAALATKLWPHVKDSYAHAQDTDVIRINSRMEAAGVTADVDFYREFIRLGSRRIRRNTSVAKDDFKIPRNSKQKPTGKALRSVLDTRGEKRKTPTGMVRADDVVLRDHKDSDGVRAVLRVRKDQKQVNTYASNILAVVNDEGKFHPNLRQSAAITRRWRSSNFYGDNGVVVKGNMQNFPRGEGIRSGIIVPKGFHLVKFDLASIEARLGSHAMKVFLDFDLYVDQYKKNPKFNVYLDVLARCTSHGQLTKKHPLYTPYKHACLGIQYGVGVETFHRTMVEMFELNYTLEECDHIYRTIRSTCPEFAQLQRVVSAVVEKQGYITDDFGAIYYVPEMEKYKAVNYYCQGCAGNVFKWFLIQLYNHLSHGDYGWGVVHDEVDMAIHKDRDAKARVGRYCDLMAGLDIFELPLTIEASDLCKNWAEAG